MATIKDDENYSLRHQNISALDVSRWLTERQGGKEPVNTPVGTLPNNVVQALRDRFGGNLPVKVKRYEMKGIEPVHALVGSALAKFSYTGAERAQITEAVVINVRNYLDQERASRVSSVRELSFEAANKLISASLEGLNVKVEDSLNSTDSLATQLVTDPLRTMAMGTGFQLVRSPDLDLLDEFIDFGNLMRNPYADNILGGLILDYIRRDGKNLEKMATMFSVLTRLESFIDDNIAFKKFAEKEGLSFDGYLATYKALNFVVEQLETAKDAHLHVGKLGAVRDEYGLRFHEQVTGGEHKFEISRPINIHPEKLADAMYLWFAESDYLENQYWGLNRAGYYFASYLLTLAPKEESLKRFLTRLEEVDSRIFEETKEYLVRFGLYKAAHKDVLRHAINDLQINKPKDVSRVDWYEELGANTSEVSIHYLSATCGPAHPGHLEWIARTLSAAETEIRTNSQKGAKHIFILLLIPDGIDIPKYSKKKPMEEVGTALERNLSIAPGIAQLYNAFPSLMHNFYFGIGVQPDPRDVQGDIVKSITEVHQRVKQDIETHYRTRERLNRSDHMQIKFTRPIISVGEDELRVRAGRLAENQARKLTTKQFQTWMFSRMGSPAWIGDLKDDLRSAKLNVNRVYIARGASWNARDIRANARDEKTLKGLLYPATERLVLSLWGPKAREERKRLANYLRKSGRSNANDIAKGSRWMVDRQLGFLEAPAPVVHPDITAPAGRERPHPRVWGLEGRVGVEEIWNLANYSLRRFFDESDD